MIYITKSPGKYCFVGNPMIFEIETSSPQIEIQITLNEKTIRLIQIPHTISDYKQYPGRVILDVADVVQSLIERKLIVLKEGSISETVSNFGFDCSVSIIDNREISTSTIHVFSGGVTKFARNILSSFDLDIFSYRLNNSLRNFLFTTRTNGHHIYLRENELYPFIFIHPTEVISLVSIKGHIIYVPQKGVGMVCSIDFKCIRETFAKLYNELPSYLVVRVGQNYSFDITFTNNTITENQFRLLFKNSLGAYECLDITGNANQIPEFEEESKYELLDENLDFESHRERVFKEEIIEVETGYKNKDELLFILDMIASDEIYILDDKYPQRCHVTSESVKIPKNITTPTSLLLKISIADKDQYYTPNIDFSYPDNIPLANITRKGYPELNGLGLIYGDETALHGE